MLGILTVVVLFLLWPAQPVMALPDNPASMNARFLHWQENSHVIHILIFDDEGRPDQPAAQVSVGQPILFGFEIRGAGAGLTVEELQALVITNPASKIILSINGGDALSIKAGWQDAFFAETRSGPAWSWDHDGDGPGDGDGDGIGDWEGPHVFFRYQSPGLSAGKHTFFICNTFSDFAIVACDTITVMAS